MIKESDDLMIGRVVQSLEREPAGPTTGAMGQTRFMPTTDFEITQTYLTFT